MRSCADLGTFLNKQQLLGRGAQVGVSERGFVQKLLESWDGQALFVVDAWKPEGASDCPTVDSAAFAEHEDEMRVVREQATRHKDRCQIMHMPSMAAAAQVTDDSLDFVYIDANHSYWPARSDIDAWWPKVRAGGFFGGFGYLDGVINRRVFGIKRAVDEFGTRERLQVRLTYDELATWFLLKPRPNRPLECRKIGMLTAYDANQAALARWSIPNKRKYCDRHHYELIVRTSGFDTTRHPVWSKLLFLHEHLGGFDWLFWSDVDSLVMNGDIRLEEFIDDSCDLVICQEDLGVGLYNLNAGQMFFRNSDWSREFLKEAYAQTQFLNDRMREQRAIIHLWERSDLSSHVQVVTQKRFNSYLQNYTRGDFLLHFPDIPLQQRELLMQTHQQFAAL